jgi:hypothetical protein
MRFDRRKRVRRLIDISAKLFTGVDAPIWDCIVMDMSDNGARIALDSLDDIPDRFMLMLGSRSGLAQPCCVVWRAGHQMGVRFELTV